MKHCKHYIDADKPDTQLSFQHLIHANTDSTHSYSQNSSNLLIFLEALYIK